MGTIPFEADFNLIIVATKDHVQNEPLLIVGRLRRTLSRANVSLLMSMSSNTTAHCLLAISAPFLDKIHSRYYTAF